MLFLCFSCFIGRRFASTFRSGGASDCTIIDWSRFGRPGLVLVGLEDGSIVFWDTNINKKLSCVQVSIAILIMCESRMWLTRKNCSAWSKFTLNETLSCSFSTHRAVRSCAVCWWKKRCLNAIPPLGQFTILGCLIGSLLSKSRDIRGLQAQKKKIRAVGVALVFSEIEIYVALR